MAKMRVVEIFSAGCTVCNDTVEMVKRIACASCDVRVLNMNDHAVGTRASKLGIRSVPAVVVDGELAACCRAGGPTEQGLRAAGVGQALS
jgi:hypothetical protein